MPDTGLFFNDQKWFVLLNAFSLPAAASDLLFFPLCKASFARCKTKSLLRYREEGLVPETGLFSMTQILSRGAYQKTRPPASALGLLFLRVPESLRVEADTTKIMIQAFGRYQIKAPPHCVKRGFCARDWIRTSTPFPAPPPQGGASTNFATRAT